VSVACVCVCVCVSVCVCVCVCIAWAIESLIDNEKHQKHTDTYKHTKMRLDIKKEWPLGQVNHPRPEIEKFVSFSWSAHLTPTGKHVPCKWWNVVPHLQWYACQRQQENNYHADSEMRFHTTSEMCAHANRETYTMPTVKCASTLPAKCVPKLAVRWVSIPAVRRTCGTHVWDVHVRRMCETITHVNALLKAQSQHEQKVRTQILNFCCVDQRREGRFGKMIQGYSC